MDSRIFLLISALSIFSLVSADVFVSIDCGSPDPYTDENLIKWSGDAAAANGESHAVHPNNSLSHVADTLRAFPTGKKNCYTVRAGRGERVLARATFFYGNYDNKSSPPTFDLLLDGNAWAAVETSSTEFTYYEVIYVLKGDSVSVCVAQSKEGQIPFISALEIRSLLPTMYDKIPADYPLYLLTRIAYGANATIRYADDPYDRIWVAVEAGGGLITVASDAAVINNRLPDEPPVAVLRNALTAVNSSTIIQLFMGIPANESGSIYLKMYFSEVLDLEPTQRRSFRVLLDNDLLLDKPIVTSFGNSTEMYSTNLTVTANSSINLVPTNDSTLPPLVNAMEVFAIGDLLTNGTNTNDVGGLGSLQKGFVGLKDWGGDPCLPAPYSWEWINCSAGPTPRVTALHLGGFGLVGALPDFSAMDALETIDFQNNSLNGSIPEFLAKLPNLKQLNLASNNFTGSIPDSLSKKNGLNLVVTGNAELCTSGSCEKSPANTPASNSPSKKKLSKMALIFGITIPLILVAI